MARLPRLSIAGEVHHVLQRGHNGMSVFVDDIDRRNFLQTLRDAATEHRVALNAYALLDDRVHLLATPATGHGLSLMLQAVGRRYVIGFNRRHGRSGTLWEGRFRATVIEAEAHLLTAMRFVEAQPVAAGLAATAAAWPWSSAAHHVGFLRDPLVTDHELYWRLGNTPFDREAIYRDALAQDVSADDADALMQATMKSWVWGSPGYVARLLRETTRPLTARRRGRPRNTLLAEAVDASQPARDDVSPFNAANPRSPRITGV